MGKLRLRDEPPTENCLTDYDRQHFGTYMRLLDAAAEGADWEEAAEEIFGIDPEKEPVRAERVHAAHLARAQWLSDNGFRHFIRSTYN